MIKYTFYLLIPFLLTFSCQSKTNDNLALKDEVIAIHDEVMPKMGTLKAHEKRLVREAEDLKSLDSIQFQQEIQKRKLLAGELDQAYEDMFVWMRQFRPNLEEMEEEEARTYLLEQKAKVEKVNISIKSTLARAEELQLED